MSAPDLVKIGAIKTEQNMNVETAVLDPIIFTAKNQGKGMVRFVLEKKGILHSYSKISIDLSDKSNANTLYSYLPIYNGIYSIIDRCVLKAGAKIISVTENFNHLMAYRSRFVGNENNLHREQVLTARGGDYNTVDNMVSVTRAAGGVQETGDPLATNYVSLDTGNPVYTFKSVCTSSMRSL